MPKIKKKQKVGRFAARIRDDYFFLIVVSGGVVVMLIFLLFSLIPHKL